MQVLQSVPEAAVPKGEPSPRGAVPQGELSSKGSRPQGEAVPKQTSPQPALPAPPGPRPARRRRWPGDRDVTAATRAFLANQHAPRPQPSGPIRSLTARCVTGRAAQASGPMGGAGRRANGRAPRPVRADVAERPEARGACAHGLPFPPARARGGRGRERE